MPDRAIQFIERMLAGYQRSYDIERFSDEEDSLKAVAHYHVTEGQHFVFKEIQMWSADSDEYAYVFYTPALDEQTARAFIDRTLKEGQPHIDLNHLSFHKQHMCTRLVAIVIADEVSPEAAAVIKKCRIYKSFQFSLKGWMEVHTVSVDLGKESVISNRYGKETAKYLKKIVSDH